MNMDTAVEGIRVGAAKFGKGVYATKSFAVEEIVGQVQGQVVHDSDHASDYCIDLFPDCSLEPAAPFRYVNHSCSPNCQLVHYDIEDEGRIVGAEIWLETTRTIAVDEQLTIDYAWPASAAIPCGCGSEDCRGWIVCTEELNRLPRVSTVETAAAEDGDLNVV